MSVKLFIMLIMVMPQIVAAQVIMAAVDEFPPYVSETQKEANMASEMVVAAFREVGYTVKFRWVPWKRAYEELKSGKVDISYPWRKTPLREEDFLFSEPLYKSREVFFHRKDVEFSWDSLSELKKYTIGGSLGYAHLELLGNAGLKVSTAKNDTMNMMKLYNGRIDLFPVDEHVGFYILSTLPTDYQHSIVSYNPKALSETENHLIVSKANQENGEQLIEKFNKGLGIITENGTLEEILARHK
ncbi:hypothetical protein GCM10007938_20750 [Vibrio zhanjiangensis]|uniref:Solute-binding protein family 3/N-terminal domain-containing protein n=1 Tax=Vibrio zhanjiangensis TaxID=1046128 RepID=A0ABQ6F0Q1_9VIBR|nr:transporter substrate-binding domain-containing protein [Vibrio zhanjiangensis]GLT18297.1 hypothetical protein GCM10007938_20750 [Vibrio zhanjiangensis]